jgi:membrane dipeptidase
VPLIDGHNDLPWQYRQKVQGALSKIDISQPQPTLHTDVPRLREGGLGGQFWSVYVPASLAGEQAVRSTMEQIDVVLNLVRRYPETFELSLAAADVERAFRHGRIASLMGMEGGHSIDSSLAALRMFYRLGARYMTLTHGSSTPWAEASRDEARGMGLTAFGREVVREMNWLGMLVDLSHVSPKTMHDALDASAAPIIFSHSSARALCNHHRNVPDDVLRRLPENGGVVMVTFVDGFISEEVRLHDKLRQAERERLVEAKKGDEPAVEEELKKWEAAHPPPRATLAQVADHLDHIRSVAGADHVGLGSDFDGTTGLPEGLEDVSTYPALTAELIRRGWADAEVEKLLGTNVLRVLRTAEAVSRRLQRQRGASEVLIEQVDAPSEAPRATRGAQ